MDADRAGRGPITAATSVPSAEQFQHRYRVRISIFVALSLLTAGVLGTAYRTANTLHRIAIVEAQRDLWQRPAEVIAALDLEPGDTVADLGCGAGYFSMKLAGRVGDRGQVLSVDIRRFPLLFLRLRARLAHHHNLETVLGESHDPHLPAESVDAVLLANTFHELTDGLSVLDQTFRALRPGGRLVVVDPDVGGNGEGPHESEGHHLATPNAAQAQLRQAGFEILDRQDRFVDQDRNVWWLVKARKPSDRTPLGVASPDHS